ncbi:DegT/DnrJ/EryC1/StrS family aminotransferase [Alteromonas sp. a30]|uniref:DegT/DnrJ/EryC1/StrS family aminotransferase n=1 Tax=Alteromonas sp. a30 TaxID=2730917 RepID=UPI00228086C6|nr:DegT/DnrJ/EryC1/StrS aminotransferase family protein [Alteromonas sp. a30]MCY7294367.1 DegT/DnrJ/EryC1/StrS aminotransferase family protein [Alteromonas sp. a30]
MLGTKLPSWPNFSQEEVEKVSNVLRSNKVNYWTGTEARSFEKEFADYFGVEYAIALSNGSVAIELALIAMGVGQGDEVVVTPRTFIASISSVINVGATPVFADVELDSGNISARTILPVLTDKTKAIICVHLGGWPCEMDEIMALANEHELYVIEDCAQSHCSSYKGKRLGSIGHVGAFSFCQDKIMTTGGEGGMLVCNDKGLWSKAWSYKDHGKSWSAVYEKEHKKGYRWLHESFGTNWRMTEMQATIGRYQLTQLDEWGRIRKSYAERYNQVARQFSAIEVPEAANYFEYVPYKHYLYVKPDALAEGWTRDRIIQSINEKGIPCFSGTCSEVYLEKAFDNTPYRPVERLPNAAQMGKTSLCFLVHPTITENDMDEICSALHAVFEQASC